MTAPARDEPLRQSRSPGALNVAHVPTEQPRDIVGNARWTGRAQGTTPQAIQGRATSRGFVCFEEISLPAARTKSQRNVLIKAAAGIAKKASSPHTVFEGVVKGVFVGRYVPGQRLVEADLMRDFSVSRGSVREALNRLAAEGIVSLHAHRGAEVRRLSRKEAADILLLLETLIGLACRLAALNISKKNNKALLRETLTSLLQAPFSTTAYEFVHLRNKFYRTLLEIGDNNELARILPSVQVHLLRAQTRVVTAKDEAVHLDDYKVMSQSILKADPDASERAGRHHVRRVIGFLEMVEEQAFAG
jgi:DNA-binding GntR family transcriptional regulator